MRTNDSRSTACFYRRALVVRMAQPTLADPLIIKGEMLSQQKFG
jgi:hypothetical protein